MADIDLLPQRGIHPLALVDAAGVAIGGTSTVAQLAARRMQAICQVDQTGIALSDGTSTVAQLASRGIRAFAAVDELGVSVDDAVTKADAIRMRGIRPMVAVDANGVSQTGSATIPVLAQRGLAYFCPVDETGTAGNLIPVPPNTIRARPGLFTLTGETMTTISGYVVTAQRGAFALAGQNATLIPPASAYTGPGDVAGWGTAYGYWGLRAYNASKIGTNCVDVCANFTGVAVSLTTVVIGSNGYADFSSIGFSPIYINKIYDQAGTQHLTLDAGGRPTVDASIVGGKPAMQFPESFPMRSVANAAAQAQPFTTGVVVRPHTFAANGIIVSDGTFICVPLYQGGSNTITQTFNGANVNNYTVTDNVLVSLITVASNASSTLSVNGAAPVTGGTAVGTNGIGASADKLCIGGTSGGSALYNGYIYEVIIKAGAVSAANQTALSTNQHAIGTGW